MGLVAGDHYEADGGFFCRCAFHLEVRRLHIIEKSSTQCSTLRSSRAASLACLTDGEQEGRNRAGRCDGAHGDERVVGAGLVGGHGVSVAWSYV